MKVNRHLRKHHKITGILLIATGLIHGLFSSDAVFSFNIGTLAWLVSILLGINYMARKFLGKFKGWMYYHRLLTILFFATIVWHIIDVDGIIAPELIFGNHEQAVSSNLTLEESILNTNIDINENGTLNNNSSIALSDGTFTGEATGYRAGLKVSVVIKDNSIISVDVTDHNEVKSRYYATPIAVIPTEIVEAQSTNVDVISGATCTSIGIMNAVNDALSSALVSGELPEEQIIPENTKNNGHGRH
jgi:Uncharacterized protein conserved in bacteria